MNIKLKAPLNIQQVILRDGTVVIPDANGDVLVDVQYKSVLLNAGFVDPLEDDQYTVVASDTATTLTAAQVAGGKNVFLTRTGSAVSATTCLSDTLPDGSNWLLNWPNVRTGDNYRLRLINKLNQGSYINFIAGSNVSILASLVSVPQGDWRDFLVTATATGVQINNIGGGTL